MQSNFKVLSLSHHKAPVDIREKMHLNDQEARSLASRVKQVFDFEELLVLSTCNRTEIYYLSDKSMAQELIGLLCMEKGIVNTSNYSEHFQHLDNHRQATLHLFRVAMGLDSMVLGDLQISNQVKQAYVIAADLKHAGPFLHRLLHTIFHCNKRVQQETAYRDGAASVSYAAAELARDLVSFLQNPSILVVGLGEMGRDTARNLQSGNFERFAVMNRSFDKAQELAEELNAEALPYEQLQEVLPQFNVVVSAVAADAPIISKEMLPAAKGGLAQHYFIDLSVPRSIAQDVEEVAGTIRYDIDDIRARTDETLERRKAAIPQVEAIVTTESEAFLAWSKELSISPTIQKLKDALEQIRRDEVARYLKKADENSAQLVDKVTKSMMNKIMKLPVLQLKAACKRGEQETLIDLLNDLFDLERSREKTDKN